MDIPKERVQARITDLEAQREQARQLYWQLSGAIQALTDLKNEEPTADTAPASEKTAS